MKNLTAIALLSLVAAASAQAYDRTTNLRDHFVNSPVAAPEIDPASIAGGLTLLAGGLAVIRGRRTKK